MPAQREALASSIVGTEQLEIYGLVYELWKRETVLSKSDTLSVIWVRPGHLSDAAYIGFRVNHCLISGGVRSLGWGTRLVPNAATQWNVAIAGGALLRRIEDPADVQALAELYISFATGYPMRNALTSIKDSIPSAFNVRLFNLTAYHLGNSWEVTGMVESKTRERFVGRFDKRGAVLDFFFARD